MAGRDPRPGAAGRRNRDRHPHPRRQVRRSDDHRRARDCRVLTSVTPGLRRNQSGAASGCSKRESTRRRSSASPACAAWTSARNLIATAISILAEIWRSGRPAKAGASRGDHAHPRRGPNSDGRASNCLRQCALPKSSRDAVAHRSRLRSRDGDGHAVTGSMDLLYKLGRRRAAQKSRLATSSARIGGRRSPLAWRARVRGRQVCDHAARATPRPPRSRSFPAGHGRQRVSRSPPAPRSPRLIQAPPREPLRHPGPSRQ